MSKAAYLKIYLGEAAGYVPQLKYRNPAKQQLFQTRQRANSLFTIGDL